jgi:hypothetical protein
MQFKLKRNSLKISRDLAAAVIPPAGGGYWSCGQNQAVGCFKSGGTEFRAYRNDNNNNKQNVWKY